MIQLPSWETRYGLNYTNSPPSWRVVDKTRGENEEIIFNLQGVIEHKVLPPILDARKVSNPHLFSQSLRLVGLGTATFNDSVNAAMQMFNVFSRQFPDKRVIVWEPPASSWTSNLGLSMSNRYFTRAKEAGHMPSVPFPADVDPKGVLNAILDDELIHTEENDVKYYTRHTDLGNKPKYFPGNPQMFRIGDIVEVQFSLVYYKMRSDKYIFKPMLYSIALLDGQFANVSCVSKIKC
ncbi:hypothetical protein BDN72DRAFT_763485 [Pluteus cervinus]|uniref:Uncharacterized protein n=1 Tax=Pluteus cervinus TaxID=181527 RepID=A0ACD3B3X6_9AGAR|nr:hypothetical protein BDN72DRAFT_763485 [Pluteus cervinus]